MYYLLPLSALLAFTAAQGVGTPSHRIILDAGNSSTVLKIYQVSVIHSNYGPDSSIKLMYHQSFSPGVRNLLTDPNFLVQHLDSILGEARQHIPSAYFEWAYLHVYLNSGRPSLKWVPGQIFGSKDGRHDVGHITHCMPNGLYKYEFSLIFPMRQVGVRVLYYYLHVYMNSGLRFLPVTDIQTIMKSIQEHLYQNRALNPFQFERSYVQLLAGEDEAVSSWLAANYLLGSLDGSRFQNETVGVLDMGRESTAITFVPDEPQYAEKYPLIFDKKRHETYTQNYLQYGEESIYVKIHNVLENRSLAGSQPWNPCMLRDDWKDVQLSDGRIVTHRGSGDPVFCEEILTHIFKPNIDDECWPKPCALGRVYQPQVHDVPFIATLGFVYTPVAMGIVDETKTLYLDRLREMGHVYCRKSLSQVMSEYEKDRETVSQDCLMSILMPTLFVHAYGFPLDTRQIRLVPDVEGEPIDYVLGMVLQLTDRYN